jgi:SagB-type dehydrogenase family enzyme
MSAVALTRRTFLRVGGILCLWGSLFLPHRFLSIAKAGVFRKKGAKRMRLPAPQLDGDVSLERAIQARRTVRSFEDKTLSLHQLSQLLWSAQGITEHGGFKRAAPSAGALYPMYVYAVVGAGCVEDLDPGIYRYEPDEHSIYPGIGKDAREDVATASLWQTWMARAPLNLVITAEYSRIMGKYGERGMRYAMIEAGHIGQNIFLQAQAMGLAVGIVGAFEDDKLIRVMGVKETHEPLLIMPVGYKG